MLDITIRASTSPVALEQLHHLAVRNLGPSILTRGKHKYAVHLDGREIARIEHARSDGALELANKALMAAVAVRLHQGGGEA